MKRRDFLTIGTGAVVSAPLIFTRKYSIFAQSSCPLAIAYSSEASTLEVENGVAGHIVTSFNVNTSQVNALVDNAIMTLTEKLSVAEAWESLFPEGALSDTTKIGIKINQSYGWDDNNDWEAKFCPFGPKAVITDAIVSGLTQMLDGTFPISNITAYDKYVSYDMMNRPEMVDPNKMAVQGYPSSSDTPYDISGPDRYRVVLIDVKDDSVFEDAPTYNAGPTDCEVPQRIIPPLYENDFWINVIIPKDHYYAGITSTLKNTYGCTDNCAGTHGNSTAMPDNKYGLRVDQYIPDFYQNITREKPCILHLMDGLAGIYDGGPIWGYLFHPNIVAVSKDPLMIAHYELVIINEARVQNSFHEITTSTTEESNEDGHVNAPHLAYASEDPYSFGTFNSENKCYNDITGIRAPEAMPSLQIPQARLLNLRRFPSGWRLGILMDNSGRNHLIESKIYNLAGQEIYSFKRISTRQLRTFIEWNRKNYSGNTVAPGVYSWKVRVDGKAFNQVVHNYY